MRYVKEKELVLAYEAAEQNADRQEILNEWDLIDNSSKK